MSTKERASELIANTPIALIGMGCFFPKSEGPQGYWRLLYHGIDAITEVPETHWSPQDYYDDDPKKPDHIYCTRGGFLSPVSFDPSEYGIPPNSLEATDSSQLLGLVAAKMALEDAGYGNGKDFTRDRTSVILGVTGTQELVIPLGARLGHPRWRKALERAGVETEKREQVIQDIADSYVQWQENSFPGLLGNVVAGRISNRLDLGGTNCVVDAACASSMSAIHLATLELISGRSDMVLTGGVDTLNDIFMHMCFGKTQILSPSGDVRPFSAAADGTLLGEGVGIVVLKRLTDAERDNDRIYAVLRAVGSSSDGRSQSIYAPRSEGQAKALRMAYDMADVSPETVELVEAHGTGTRVGDQTEFTTLKTVFGNRSAPAPRCALGAVKSMIGHTKAAAGTAGLIKAALSLHHKVLPPTIKAKTPDPKLDIDHSPFYLNTAPRPWLAAGEHPRRSAVSSFGFGGSNFHVLLEEYQKTKTVTGWDGSVDIIALSGPTVAELQKGLTAWQSRIDENGWSPKLASAAAESRSAFDRSADHRLVMVVDLTPDAKTTPAETLAAAAEALAVEDMAAHWQSGDSFYGSGPVPGKLAFMFPGQGSQYVNMGRDLVCTFPEAMAAVDALNAGSEQRLSDLIYPLPADDRKAKTAQEDALRSTDVAQPSIGAVSLAMLDVLCRFGVTAEATCGHSYGELTALMAAGWIDADAFYTMSKIRGQLMADAGRQTDSDPGTMLAVKAPLEKIDALVADADADFILANRNSPTQGVLSGTTAAIEAAAKLCKAQKMRAIKLPVAAAFHSHLVGAAQKPFQKHLAAVNFQPTDTQVYSNTTGEAYPADAEQTRQILGSQILNPVDFVSNVENLYTQTGVRTFVEIGPKTVLTGLARQILKGRDVFTMAVDASGGKRFGVVDLALAIAHLAALGYAVRLDQWQEPPTVAGRKPVMSVPIGGANYSGQGSASAKSRQTSAPTAAEPAEKASRPKPVDPKPAVPQPEPKTEESTHNAQAPMKNPPASNRAVLDVVREGLKSIQELQAQTAKAHELFLQTQAQAGRTLQMMIESTRQLTGAAVPITGMESTAAVPPPAMPAAETAPTTADTLPIEPTITTEDPLVTPLAQNPPSIAASEPTPSITTQADETPTTNAAADLPVADTLVAVVSELTGYPEEMLNLDMDIEADLGIDSIKRVEILSTMEERLPQLPSVSPEEMGALKTLGQIVSYLTASSAQETPADPADIPVAAMASGSEVQSGLDRTSVATQLVTVVAELTGYPEEMLNLDMDIEADLGIDSIKRVEILSTMEERLPQLPSVSPEEMGTLKTLGQIADYLCTDDGVVSVSATPPTQNTVVTDTAADDEIIASMRPDPAETEPVVSRRALTATTIAAAVDPVLQLPAGHSVYITDDATGLSQAIAEALARDGIDTFLIPPDLPLEDLNGPPPAGLLIVAPPDGYADAAEAQNAFLMAQKFGPQLTAASQSGEVFFATVARMDGAFGLRGYGLRRPLQGALAGLIKTAAIEWPEIVCRALDVDTGWNDNEQIAAAVTTEVLCANRNGPKEVGLQADLFPDRRCVPTLAPVAANVGPMPIDDSDVLVVSGGARGITAACIEALARKTSPKLVLLGRSPIPEPEPAWLIGVEGEAEMKKAILKNESSDTALAPKDLQRRYHLYIAQREIGRTLEQLDLLGIQARYLSVDIRDLSQVQSALDRVRVELGPVSGIVHAAGVLEDRLISDKTQSQFDRVFGTKVDGLDHLLTATASDPLKLMVIFSSVAGRSGNRGQVDYAMANEVLNKTAQREAATRRHCKVVAINWGPWDGGMVSDGVKRQFSENNINLIPVEEGAEAFVTEITASSSSAVEVVVGADLHSDDANLAAATTQPVPQATIDQWALSFKREIDVQQYPVLNSHILDGKPVVPFALMAEWFGHGALHENPGLVLHGIDDMRLLNGIRIDEDKKTIRLMAGKPTRKGAFYQVPVELRDGFKDGQVVVHSRGHAVLSDTPVQAPAFQIPDALADAPYSRSIDEVYERILFHGSGLHGLRHIRSLNRSGMVAEIDTAPDPEHWMADPLRSSWLSDPLVLDSAFQMASVWCYEQQGMVSLPSYAASYRQYCQRFPSEGVLAVMETLSISRHKLTADYTFLSADNQVLARLSGVETIMDTTLHAAFKANKQSV